MPTLSKRLPLGWADDLQSRWDLYCGQLRHCQKHPTEPAVHKLRVITRRLIAGLALLESVLPGARIEKARRPLKRYLKVLGSLRDSHVQLRLLRRFEAACPEVRDFRKRLEKKERTLTRIAARKIRHFKTRKLDHSLQSLTEALADEAHNSRGQKQMVTAALHSATKAFAEVRKLRQAIDPADPATIHKLRLGFKKFRYLVESLSPWLTGFTARDLRALGQFQRRMGLIQDLEVLAQSVAAFARKHPRRARSFPRFLKRLQQRRARALRSFLNAADQAYRFWPPPGIARPSLRC